jgi:hypothetical protein
LILRRPLLEQLSGGVLGVAHLRRSVSHGMHTCLPRTIGATIHPAVTFHSVTDDSAMAAGTLWSQRLNRTFKTIKHMLLAILFDAKTLVVIITA